MNAAIIAAAVAASNAARQSQMHHQHMMAEQRRREEEARRRKRREQEEKERKALIEHRKTAPLEYTGEDWQKNRFLKAMSEESVIQTFLGSLKDTKKRVIDNHVREEERKIVNHGQDYAEIRAELDQCIAKLQELNVPVSGKEYSLTRLAISNSAIAKPQKAIEELGTIFLPNQKTPIRINLELLKYNTYIDQYDGDKHQELKDEYRKVSKKTHRYERIGKVLSFLLKSEKYQGLKKEEKQVTSDLEDYNKRKANFDSFSSLTKEQLEAIREYLLTLKKLRTISTDIENGFSNVTYFQHANDKRIYEETISEFIDEPDNKEIVANAYGYIERLFNGDPETINEAYERVKGQYPIQINNQFLYDIMLMQRTHAKEVLEAKTLQR